MHKCQILPSNSTVDQDLLAYLETVFKSLACINASFLLNGEEHYGCSSKRPGIDLNNAGEAFEYIAKIENDTIRELVIQHQLFRFPLLYSAFLDLAFTSRYYKNAVSTKSSRR